jgi:hypothetical protein
LGRRIFECMVSIGTHMTVHENSQFMRIHAVPPLVRGTCSRLPTGERRNGQPRSKNNEEFDAFAIGRRPSYLPSCEGLLSLSANLR